MGKSGIGSQKFVKTKKSCFIWPVYMFKGTHLLIPISALIRSFSYYIKNKYVLSWSLLHFFNLHQKIQFWDFTMTNVKRMNDLFKKVHIKSFIKTIFNQVNIWLVQSIMEHWNNLFCWSNCSTEMQMFQLLAPRHNFKCHPLIHLAIIYVFIQKVLHKINKKYARRNSIKWSPFPSN